MAAVEGVSKSVQTGAEWLWVWLLQEAEDTQGIYTMKEEDFNSRCSRFYHGAAKKKKKKGH